MKCPVCAVDLLMSERSGIEIDYCPQCRGVWLDRGELDKIIERSSLESAAARPASPYRERGDAARYDHDERRYEYEERRREYDSPRYYEGDRSYDGRKSYKKKKRGGFLEDLFEFGD